MNRIAQEVAFRLAVVRYAERHGPSQAAIQYRVSRMTVYRWRKRYDGTKESLVPRSRRPHHHPNQHTKAEDALIRNMRRRRPHDGLVVFWVRLRMRGCTRSITGLYRHMRRMKLYAEKLPNPKYIPKPYKPASFPGEKVQIDVKVVPKSCMAGKALDEGLRLCQYTAIDECTRLRCLGAFEEQSTFSSAQFLQQLVDAFPFPIRKVQTDGGTEFTKRFTKGSGHDETLFEKQLREYGIEHQKIRPYTPRHNGKVERSHRKDNEAFDASHKFDSFADFKRQLARRNRICNAFPMRPLGWDSPNGCLKKHLAQCNIGLTNLHGAVRNRSRL